MLLLTLPRVYSGGYFSKWDFISEVLLLTLPRVPWTLDAEFFTMKTLTGARGQAHSPANFTWRVTHPLRIMTFAFILALQKILRIWNQSSCLFLLKLETLTVLIDILLRSWNCNRQKLSPANFSWHTHSLFSNKLETVTVTANWWHSWNCNRQKLLPANSRLFLKNEPVNKVVKTTANSWHSWTILKRLL